MTVELLEYKNVFFDYKRRIFIFVGLNGGS